MSSLFKRVQLRISWWVSLRSRFCLLAFLFFDITLHALRQTATSPFQDPFSSFTVAATAVLESRARASLQSLGASSEKPM